MENKNLIYSNISKEELNNLYLENKYFLTSIAYRVLKESKIILEIEDLKSEAAIIFLNIIKKFDTSYNVKLSTFIFNNVYYYLKNYIRDNFFDSSYNNINCDINDMNLYNESNDINELINLDKNEKIINDIKKVLTNKELKYVNKVLEDKECEFKIKNIYEKQIIKSIKHKIKINNIEFIY